MELKIDKNIPLPSKRGTGFALTLQKMKMKKGDSTFIKGKLASNICNAARRAFGAGAYATRKEGDGVRLWRVK